MTPKEITSAYSAKDGFYLAISGHLLKNGSCGMHWGPGPQLIEMTGDCSLSFAFPFRGCCLESLPLQLHFYNYTQNSFAYGFCGT